IALPLDSKKYVASLCSAAAVRTYVLVSGLIEESLNETEEALNRADAALRKAGADKKPIEEALLKDAVAKVLAAHSDWDLSGYGYGAPKDEVKKEDAPVSDVKKDDPPQGK
ncbi:MAG: hypothetical protein WCS90_03055, partial [Bacilli bacterium]